MALNGWHRGELSIRSRLGLVKDPETMYLYGTIDGEMPEQHREFHTTRLPFIPVTVLDAQRRPWGAVLAGEDGRTGFVSSPTYSSLLVRARLWEGDPLMEVVGLGREGEVDRARDGGEGRGGEALIAGIGVELSTRRRSKFAGKITSFERVKGDDKSVRLRLDVNQALGNCPKYITTRSLYSYPNALPKVVYNKPNDLTADDRLPEDVISFIQASDTVFLGTTYAARKEETRMFPSHLGMNHRGGRPGFMRVVPSDGRTVVLPDYSGNRYMTSLGNIEATPHASLTILSFTNGDVLYLTGIAKNLLGLEANAIMPLQERITTVYITGYTFVKNALPFRSLNPLTNPTTPVNPNHPTDDIKPSPYSPPIRYLAEESARAPSLIVSSSSSVDQFPKALLTGVTVHSLTAGPQPGPNDIATFTFRLDGNTASNGEGNGTHVQIRPGQAIILSFTPLFGQKQYFHMFPSRPREVNDNRIRTWSVVSSSQWWRQRHTGPSSPGPKSGQESVDLSSTDWTLSNTQPPSPNGTASDQGSNPNLEFSLTMRLRPSGFVTTALFTLIRRVQENKPEMLDRPGGMADLGIQVGVLGVSGGFSADGDGDGDVGVGVKKETYISGGIGITPFLGMIHAMVNRPQQAGKTTTTTTTSAVRERDVHLVLSTREPEMLLPLIAHALTRTTTATTTTATAVIGTNTDDHEIRRWQSRRKIKLRLDVFSHASIPDFPTSPPPSSSSIPSSDEVEVRMVKHGGRVDGAFFDSLDSSLGTLAKGKDERDADGDVGLGVDAEGGGEEGEKGRYWAGREVCVCGPDGFANAVIGWLPVGVQRRVRREGFEY
ncbi:hypothetical protein AX17_006655 [Amanita inopinata Kibby_2008]|nr:hypothetical protein AX17_006655 [Amanita inopinata Kibby_2008]